MNNLNSLILEGIAKEVKVTTTLSGIKITEFNIEVARHDEELNVFSVQCFGNRFAEIAEKMPDKEVRLVGRLKQNKWTDSDGKAHSKFVVIAEHIDIKDKQ